MKSLAMQWVYTIIGALAVGPVAGVIASSIRGVDGSSEATGLVSASGVMGLLKLVLCVVLAGVVMVAGAWLGFIRRAYFVGGIVLAWAAARTGTVPAVIRESGGDGVFMTLAIEGLVLGAIFAVFAWLTAVIRRKADEKVTLPSIGDARAILAVVLVGMVCGWAIGQDGSIGQTLFASFAAGLFGTFVARVISPTCSFASVAWGASVLAFVAPLIWALQNGSTALADMYEGSIAGYALITPLTWLSGVSLGLWGGSSWADSMVQKHDPKAGTDPARRAANG